VNTIQESKQNISLSCVFIPFIVTEKNITIIFLFLWFFCSVLSGLLQGHFKDHWIRLSLCFHDIEKKYRVAFKKYNIFYIIFINSLKNFFLVLLLDFTQRIIIEMSLRFFRIFYGLAVISNNIYLETII